MPSKKLILRTYLTPEEHAQIRASASKADCPFPRSAKGGALGFPSQVWSIRKQGLNFADSKETWADSAG